MVISDVMFEDRGEGQCHVLWIYQHNVLLVENFPVPRLHEQDSVGGIKLYKQIVFFQV